MADDSIANVPSPGRKLSSREAVGPEKPATSWLIPAITAVGLASLFCLYYFVYVGAQREYLANRNFRSLAVLGDQVQTMVSIHGSILEFSADLADPSRNPTRRIKQNLKDFLIVRNEDQSLPPGERDRETRKDYLKYLAPSFELTETTLKAQSKPGSRFEVLRRNGRWELVLAAQRHNVAKKDYIGSLELDGMLNPFIGSLPFDDILLVSEKGTIVYQSNKAGPQFTTLTSLLQAQPEGAGAKSKGGDANSEEREAAGAGNIAQNADQTWRTGSKHLTDVALAGTRYKLFMQPVLVDVFSDDSERREPAREWVLCGLRSAKALQWEALSISSTLIIWFTALFLAVCMSGPVLKILLMNQRERLRLRDVGFLGMFLVLLTGVFTLSGLEAVGFPLNDDTETQLELLGHHLSGNIHDELRDMRDQLIDWCSNDRGQNLAQDLTAAETREVIRNTPSESKDEDDDARPNSAPTPPPALRYAYLNNAFWTDDDGQQIVKWSTSGYLTPMIDLSTSRIITKPKTIYLDGKPPAFYFDSLVPPNKLEYLAALTMSTGDCYSGTLPAAIRGNHRGKPAIREDVTGGSAVITGQPFSLIDPILPFGYGFALLDDTGLVLFHSDKTRNMHENFLQESDWSRQLYAASFGHATRRSLRIKYLGKDYLARVVPIPGVSQAPWSLIVYRDLTSVRTLNLQAMTMASTLLLFIFAGPVVVIAVWCALRRPRFAPEWLWPNRARCDTYRYQMVIYTLLILVFLFLAFTGSLEQNVIACAAVPYAALLLTVWCFRIYPPRPKKSAAWLHVPAMLSILAAIAILAATWRRVHAPALQFWLGFGLMAAAPVAAGPRDYLIFRWKRAFPEEMANQRNLESPAPDSFAWRKYYVVSLVLLLLLLGVLTPMALFRASLTVERRLGVKQAQLHLASALGRRLLSTRERCKTGELGAAACNEFKNEKSTIWGKIVLDPLFPAGGMLPVEPHSFSAKGGEFYSGWLQNLVYVLHHDYNHASAEMLGVITDRLDPRPASDPKPNTNFPDWAWENDRARMTLRWHGVHLPRAGNPKAEDDLLITSTAPVSSWRDVLAGAAVAIGVTLIIGLLFWALARRVFLFNITPLKMTGARKAVESIREGRNVVVLTPPVSDWRLEDLKSTIDLREISTGPKWAEAFDLDAAPFNGLVEIRHFEYTANDAEIDNQKFILLERLLAREHTQLVVVLTVPVSSQDYRRMFPAFEVVDLREEPFYWLKQYEGPALDHIWKECGPMPALWPMGAQLAKDLNNTEDIHSEETIASELLERADPYYRLVWKESSPDQKFALAQLAEDGLLNPLNGRAIRQLARRGLITTDPQFRIVNESFRRFLRSHTSADLKRDWMRESRRSGWGKVSGAFFTTMILLGIFLLTTQNQLWESSAAYVTTALGALGTFTKLWNTYRGAGAEKPG